MVKGKGLKNIKEAGPESVSRALNKILFLCLAVWILVFASLFVVDAVSHKRKEGQTVNHSNGIGR